MGRLLKIIFESCIPNRYGLRTVFVVILLRIVLHLLQTFFNCKLEGDAHLTSGFQQSHRMVTSEREISDFSHIFAH